MSRTILETSAPIIVDSGEMIVRTVQIKARSTADPVDSWVMSIGCKAKTIREWRKTLRLAAVSHSLAAEKLGTPTDEVRALHGIAKWAIELANQVQKHGSIRLEGRVDPNVIVNGNTVPKNSSRDMARLRAVAEALESIRDKSFSARRDIERILDENRGA